jgi:hypothetical protein
MSRKNKVWLVLAGLVLLVGAALADYNVRDHVTHYQNASTGLRTNAGGDLRSELTNPEQTFTLHEPEWLSSILVGRSNGGLPPSPAVLQDSTTATDVRGYNGLALLCYPTFDDSVSAVALALQVRWHYSATVDSLSTFIEQATKTNVAGAPVFASQVRDSIGGFAFIPATAGGLTRYRAGDVNDSLATPDEQVLVLTNVSGVNRGRIIRIRTPDGLSGNAAGPYMSIRIRHLQGYNGSGVPWGNGAAGAGASSHEPQTRLRVDLVGWR